MDTKKQSVVTDQQTIEPFYLLNLMIRFKNAFLQMWILLVVLSWVVIFVFINNSLSQLGRVLRKETVIQMPMQ